MLKLARITATEAPTALVQRIRLGMRLILSPDADLSLLSSVFGLRSRFDLVLMPIDDKLQAGDVALNADGVSVHALLVAACGVSQDGRGRDSQLARPLVPG